MLSPLRNRFGIPGVISVIALVFAMFGGAYAASSNDDGKATASAKAKKAKKGPRGPKGPAGPSGPTGPAGPQGPAGAKGNDGAPGAKGDAGAAGAQGIQGIQGNPGTAGAAGKSVKVEPELTGTANCEGLGGASVEKEGSPASKAFVCNGKQGAAGVAGPPGPTCPDGNCLAPAGSTQTGVWSFVAQGVSHQVVSISLPLRTSEFPLVSYRDRAKTGEEAVAMGCPGNEEDPKADPFISEGFELPRLCMYESFDLVNAEFAGQEGASSGGIFVRFNAIDPEKMMRGVGSWAVAAP